MKTTRLVMMLLALLVSTISMAQNADILYKEGKALYDAKDYDKAFPKLKAAAEKGHKKAQYRLGRCYDKGHGTAEDNATAVKWYKKSSDQGYAKAHFQMGKAYMKGKGVAADESKARTLLRKAVNDAKHGKEIMEKLRSDADAGDADAQRMLTLIKKK